jgi:hypothetical protein
MTLMTSGARKKQRWAALTAVVAVLSLAIGSIALANHVGSVSGVFESGDGNLAVDHLNPGSLDPVPVDWNSFTNAGTATAWNFEDFTDATGNPDDIYNGGIKQDDDCPGVKSGSLGGGNSKFDVSRIYLANRNIDGDEYLFLSWIRVPQNSTTASSHIAYEFNKGLNGTCPDSDLLRRSEDDMLIVYDFEGGTASPSLKLLRWVTSGACEVASNSAPCWGDVTDLNSPGVSDARVNTTAVGPVVDALTDPDQTLGVVEFGEAGINLSAAEVFSAEECEEFGSVTAVSRSSGNSGTAQMKDKVGPIDFEIGNCGSVVVHKTDADTDELVGGATFSITPAENIDENGEPVDEDLVSAMVEIADGVFCADELFAGEYRVTEETPPADYDLASPDFQDVTVAADGTTCDSRLDEDGEFEDAEDAADATFANPPHKFRVLVLTCTDPAEGDSELVASSIELDPGDETTPQATSTDIADTLEIDQDDLCDLADYFDVSAGEHTVDLDVNNPPAP